jgi:lysophospholipase L1-like esterase
MSPFIRLYLFTAVFFVMIGKDVLAQEKTQPTKNEIIISNCKNWDLFQSKFHQQKNNPESKTSLLFLGDSHIQGGYSTNRIRNLFREEGFTMGRGFIFPYKLAQTNGPEDIVFKSTAHWAVEKWKNTPNKCTPFGYVLSSNDTAFDLIITYKPGEQAYPFQKITFFHSKDSISITCNEPSITYKSARLTESISFTEIKFKHPVDSCFFKFHSSNRNEIFTLYSVYTQNLEETASLNALGINGISYQQYSRNIELEPWLSFLHPDCIILSLGTNDIFSGKADTLEICRSITQLVRKIKRILPETALILTTPNDHLLRKRYLNRNIPQLCSIIKNVAINEQCAFWDFFNIMGGMGSAWEWHHNGLLYKDFVHLSKNGYKLQGELFYQALYKALNQD